MKTKSLPCHGRGVQEFLARHGKDVTGVVYGFDRLRLQGTLRALYQPEIMAVYLQGAGVVWKEFKTYVCGVTARIRAAAETKKLELRLEEGRCGHLSFYFIHPQLGLMHLRLQTWFPFLVQFCCNGREWLVRQLTAAGIDFRREDNCLPWIADVPRAQALLDQQVRQHWPSILEPLITQHHPAFRELQRVMPLEYYWTVAESEYAADVMFRDRAALQRIYPALVHHSMMSFGAEQVLRFLGRKQVGPAAEVKTTLRQRTEGVCVKHWLNRNSLKAYDKGSILRSEGTMNEPADFRVWRQAEGKGKEPLAWRELRRSVKDMPRRAEVLRTA